MRKIEHLHKMQLEHGETQRASRLDIILKALCLYEENFQYDNEFEISIYNKIKHIADHKGMLIITWNEKYGEHEMHIFKELWALFGNEEKDNVISRYSLEYVKNNSFKQKISFSNLGKKL